MTSPRISLMGIPIDALDARQAIDHIDAAITRGDGGWVVTPNLDILRRLVTDAEFRGLCASASLLLPDGTPLVWASRLQRTPLRERVAGSDLIWSLSERAALHGWRAFFLGGNPGTAEGAARFLAQKYPGLVIAGTECPPLGFELEPDYMNALARRLAQASPHLVYVALGSPKQERVISALRTGLQGSLSGAWFLGIGISFSFVVGDVRRAPRWMQRLGFEWLHRLLQEPRRLARRYLIDGLPFALRLWSSCAIRGFSRRRALGDNP